MTNQCPRTNDERWRGARQSSTGQLGSPLHLGIENGTSPVRRPSFEDGVGGFPVLGEVEAHGFFVLAGAELREGIHGEEQDVSRAE